MGLGLLGVQVVLLARQDKLLGRGDRALEGVTKAAIVLGKTISGQRLGDGSRRLEDQGGAKSTENGFN